MLTKQEFDSIIAKYPLEKIGFTRDRYLDLLIPVLSRREILILKGVRRCGKTTIMKQLIQHLIKDGVSEKQILYVNLDDFNFLPHLSLELLEFILSTRDFGKKQYIFLDEIQKIPQFEAWLRTQYDRELNAKFIISGSNSSLLAKELATLLTGRNLTYEIYPCTFTEFKKATRRNDIEEYLTFGGFPEVILEKNIQNKRKLLSNYVTDIINKDILLRRSVKDQNQLLLFAQYVLQNPGVRLSVNKLSKQTNISKETVRKYLDYMIDAYLIMEVPFFSYSAKSKFVPSNIPKYYVTDTGFYLVNTPRVEKGKLWENAVAQALFRTGKGFFYWADKNEVDFVLDDVAYNVVSSASIPAREKKGLEEIQKAHKHITTTILINPDRDETKESLEFKSLKRFLVELNQ